MLIDFLSPFIGGLLGVGLAVSIGWLLNKIIFSRRPASKILAWLIIILTSFPIVIIGEALGETSTEYYVQSLFGGPKMDFGIWIAYILGASNKVITLGWGFGLWRMLIESRQKTTTDVDASFENLNPLPPVNIQNISDSNNNSICDENEELIWLQMTKEAASSKRRAGLWARCFAQADGDENKAIAYYVTERVRQERPLQ